MKAKYIQIFWRDATSVDAWTQAIHITPECHLIETVGILIAEDNKAITVALSHDPSDGAYSQFLHIPKKWIEKRSWIKID